MKLSDFQLEILGLWAISMCSTHALFTFFSPSGARSVAALAIVVVYAFSVRERDTKAQEPVDLAG